MKTPSRRFSIERLENRLLLAVDSGGLSYPYSAAIAVEDTSAATVAKEIESKPASSDPTDFYWSGSEKVFLREVEGELAVGFSSPAARLGSVDSLLSAGGALENASFLRELKQSQRRVSDAGGHRGLADRTC